MISSDRFSQRHSHLNLNEGSNDTSNPILDRFSQRNKQIEFPSESEEERGYEQSIASTLTHGLGQVAAVPGNIRDLFYAASDESKRFRNMAGKALGLNIDENEFFKSSQEREEKILSPFKFSVDKLPNSQDVNKFIDEMWGGYFAPTNEGQKFANEISEDIVNSALNRGPKSLYRNVVTPILSNVVEKGMKLFGADPEKSSIGKFLTWIGMDMAGLSNPRDMVSRNMNRNRRLIPKTDEIIVSNRDINHLKNLEKRLKSGGTSPSKTAALTKIEETLDAIQGNKIPASYIHDSYRTINELKTNYGAFNVEGAAKPGHVHNLNRIQKLNNNLLNRYGRNQNPKFLKEFRENNAAWAALEQSDDIARYVKKHYNKPFVSEAAKVLFSKPYGLPVAAGATALERLQSFASRLKNPALRKYYGNVLAASLKDNSAVMISNLQKLDKELKNQEEKD